MDRAQFASEFINKSARRDLMLFELYNKLRERPKVKGSKQSSEVENVKRSLTLLLPLCT